MRKWWITNWNNSVQLLSYLTYRIFKHHLSFFTALTVKGGFLVQEPKQEMTREMEALFPANIKPSHLGCVSVMVRVQCVLPLISIMCPERTCTLYNVGKQSHVHNVSCLSRLYLPYNGRDKVQSHLSIQKPIIALCESVNRFYVLLYSENIYMRALKVPWLGLFWETSGYRGPNFPPDLNSQYLWNKHTNRVWKDRVIVHCNLGSKQQQGWEIKLSGSHGERIPPAVIIKSIDQCSK